MHTKRFNILFKRWVQFRVGAISRLQSLPTKFTELIMFPFIGSLDKNILERKKARYLRKMPFNDNLPKLSTFLLF